MSLCIVRNPFRVLASYHNTHCRKYMKSRFLEALPNASFSYKWHHLTTERLLLADPFTAELVLHATSARALITSRMLTAVLLCRQIRKPNNCLFFLICIVGGGVQTGSTRHVGHKLAYCTCPGLLWGWRIWWNKWQGKPKYSEKTCPGATLSTTNPTWPDTGLNPGRRGGKPATNRFSYGAAEQLP
jgi:hypothetical protein